jgi:hypothetical protein
MTRYAESTSVGSDKSRAEIERTLARYGASSFMYGWDQDRAMVGFIAAGRQVRFVLPMPNREDREFTHTPQRGNCRSPAQAEEAYEQAVRQRWRALAVEAGIVTFDEEFAMHFLLPNGQTVGEWVTPQIERVYAEGGMLALLPGGNS